MNRAKTFVAGRRTLVVGIAVTAFVGAGIAAAAAGDVPWSDAALGATGSAIEAGPDPTTTIVSIATTAAPDVATAGDQVNDSAATEGTEPAPVILDVPVDEPTDEPTTQPTATTEPAAPEPAVEPAAAEPAVTPATEHTTDAPAPPTTEFHDTAVPEGISLSCAADGSTVTCSWSGGVVPGFAKFLLLRGDGGARGRVPFQSSDPSANSAIDAGVPAGSYSYVVVAVDGNSKALVHSNPVFVQIGAVG